MDLQIIQNENRIWNNHKSTNTTKFADSVRRKNKISLCLCMHTFNSFNLLLNVFKTYETASYYLTQAKIKMVISLPPNQLVLFYDNLHILLSYNV